MSPVSSVYQYTSDLSPPKPKVGDSFVTVRDPKSSTGWTVELGPFPGWKDVPTW
jgi:hypothetical protein